MARNFTELRRKMSAASQRRAQRKAQVLLHEMALEDLRRARSITQEHLAAILNVKQSSISKMERRTDMYLSTLSKFIEAMGGKLEINAVFPEGAVRVNQFRRLGRSERKAS